jgi:hypothetical protein
MQPLIALSRYDLEFAIICGTYEAFAGGKYIVKIPLGYCTEEVGSIHHFMFYRDINK